MLPSRTALFLFSTLLYFCGSTVLAAPVMVATEWLAKKLEEPNHANEIAVLDMSSEDVQYQRFHIPGAIRLPYDAIVSLRKQDKVMLKISDNALANLLGALGVTHQKYIIVYDDMGGLNAGRLFWQLENMGHKEVSVLDGGLVKWILENRPVTNQIPAVVPQQYLFAHEKSSGNNVAELSDIRVAIKNKSSLLLDVRSQEEYLGEIKQKRSGHIPTARWWPWEDALDLAAGFSLRAKKELQASLDKIGVKDKHTSIILYCRSGHRAAQSYMTLRALGYQEVKLYDASMAEYEQDLRQPLNLGSNP